MTDGKGSGDRPFYELPKHIKPCSRIIHETRLQLSNNQSRSATQPRLPPHLNDRYGSAPPTLQHSHHAAPFIPSDLSGGGDFFPVEPPPDLPGGLTRGGARVVQTQRPKTGTDHNSALLWGLSSRKRPPSAITLNRLCLTDDADTDELWDDEETGTGLGLGSIHTNVHDHAHHGHAHQLGGASLDSALSPPTSGKSGSSRAHKTHKSKKNAMAKAKSLSMTSIAGEELAPEEEEIKEAVDQLEVVGASASSSKSEIIPALQRVQSVLEKQKTERKKEGAGLVGPLRARLLRLVFALVERNQSEEELVFWASFLLLHCRLRGNNLTTLFKMVFKASRWREGWETLAESDYLPLLVPALARTSPLPPTTEALIYGYGTLKFIALHAPILRRLLHLRLLAIMAHHLKTLNDHLAAPPQEGAGAEGEESSHSPSLLLLKGGGDAFFNAAFQLTSILRSVLGEESSVEEVLSTGLLDELCHSLRWTVEDMDVLSNVVRILSVVSSGGRSPCAVICANDTFATSLVDILETWGAKEDIVVRMSYTLGNLLAHSEDMRLKLFATPGAYAAVVRLLALHLDAAAAGGGAKGGGAGMAQDILIKTVRILANWSLTPAIGHHLSADPSVVALLNEIIGAKGEGDGGKELTSYSEELIVCVMSTLNNITFYQNYEGGGGGACEDEEEEGEGRWEGEGPLETAQNLYPYLTWANLEGRTEVMKVLGNLTRGRVIRGWVGGQAEHVEKLMRSLQMEVGGEGQGGEELVSATLGVLMNIIVDGRACGAFLGGGGVELLLTLLQGRSEVGVLLMVCQFLWNIHVSSSCGGGSGGWGDVEREGEDPLAPIRDGDGGGRGLTTKQKMEIRGLLRRRLEGVVEGGEEEEEEEEFRAVGGRLYEKLGE